MSAWLSGTRDETRPDLETPGLLLYVVNHPYYLIAYESATRRRLGREYPTYRNRTTDLTTLHLEERRAHLPSGFSLLRMQPQEN